MVERVNKVWATRTRLTVDGVPPTVHQLALACEVDDDDILECLAIGPNHILSLDTPVGPEGESTLGDMLDHADPDDSPEKELVVEMMRREIRLVLGKLDAREAGVIALRFGLDDDEPRTLEEIGEVYNVTRERIRQIEGKTMTKLRHPDLCERLWDYLD
jgi:RNA polymerase primary sigma factor